MTKTSLPIAMLLAASLLGGAAHAQSAATPYFAKIDVRRDGRVPATTKAKTIAGVVFDDANRNGRLDAASKAWRG